MKTFYKIENGKAQVGSGQLVPESFIEYTEYEQLPLRTCSCCGLEAITEDDLDMFRKDTNSKYGRLNKCKLCANKDDKIKNKENPRSLNKNRADYMKKYRNQYYSLEENKTRRKEYYIHNKDRLYKNKRAKEVVERYGVTVEYVEKALELQNFRCCICDTDITTKYNIDHCHTSGKYRGLLCMKCNTGLGMFSDNVEVLDNAIKYLKGSNTDADIL